MDDSWLKLCNNLLHRHRHRSSSDFRSATHNYSNSASHHVPADSRQLLLLRFPEHRFHTQQESSNHGAPENTTPQLSSPGQLSTTQTTNRATIELCSTQELRNVSRYVTNHRATIMKYYDFVTSAVNRFLEPFTECASVSDEKDRYYTGSGLRD